jgi:hypothetical protein
MAEIGTVQEMNDVVIREYLYESVRVMSRLREVFELEKETESV